MRRTLLICLMLLLTTLAYTGVQGHGKIPPGVVVAGVPVGGLSYRDAQLKIEQRAAQFSAQRVTLTYEGTTWQPTLAELGVSLDVAASRAQLAALDSPANLLDRALRAFRIRSGPLVLGTPLKFDHPSLETYCRERMRELGLAPVDAELLVDGESIMVTQDASGFVVSVDRLRQDLARQLSGFTSPSINLTTTLTTASVRAIEIQSDVATLDAALDQPLVLHTDSEQWEIAPGQMAEHVRLDETGESPRVVIDEAAITALVDGIAGQIDQPVSNGYLDDSGLYGRIVLPHDGRLVDKFEFNRRIHEAIASGKTDVEIPVTIIPTTGDIKTLTTEYGVTNLIGSGSSDFSGSDQGRDTNVRRAAELIDGTLVAPGEVFSFNQALGSINAVGGFVPAGATEGGIPGTAVGGGVCQVSTTIFRAVLKAGMPIVEWYPHVYRSTFYEQGGWAPGFDASIQQPDDDPLNGPDLKFRNITDGWLLIRVTATSGSELKVSLFGQATGFDVVLSDPLYLDIVGADETPIEEVDASLPAGSSNLYQPARDGVTMVVRRTVYASDGTIVSDEEFVSTYQPQGPIYRVSADMASNGASGT